MRSDTVRFRLSQLPTAPRVLLTAFALMMGIGYLVSLANLFFTYSDADGKPGVTPEDLKIRLYGNRDRTVLESVISPGGKMAIYLLDPAEREKIIHWVHNGALVTRFSTVQPIFERNCVRCHNSNGLASFRPLTNYQQVSAVAQVDQGESPGTWARVAHAHIQGLGLVYLALGLMFSFCAFKENIKAFVVAAPFMFMLMDFGTRGLVRFNENMIYGVLISGMGLGAATGTMILGILWELWVRPYREKRAAERSEAPRAREPLVPAKADGPAAMAE